MTSTHGLSAQETAALTRRVTYYSVGVAAVLVAIKVAAWLASGSVALLASTADSALDLLASLATFWAVRFAVAPPDAEHRFGHGKAEGFASLVQAGLVFASAALIGQEAIGDLIHPKAIGASGWALAVMGVSIVLTALLIAAQGRVLKRTASVAVSGDRAHYAADLASNLFALIGIGATAWLGDGRLDAIAALAIAALLLWGAVGVFREASNELMDHELPDAVRARIVDLDDAGPPADRRSPAAHAGLGAVRPYPDARRSRPGADPGSGAPCDHRRREPGLGRLPLGGHHHPRRPARPGRAARGRVRRDPPGQGLGPTHRGPAARSKRRLKGCGLHWG